MVTRLILILFIITACQNKKEAAQLISIDDINYESIQKNSGCGKIAEESFGLTESLANSFIRKVQKKYKGRSFERVILFFYTVEGEIIYYYEGSLLISSNNKIKGDVTNLNLNTTNSKEIKNFNIDNFYKYMATIEEETSVNSSRLFVIDIDSKKTTCTFFENVKFPKSKELLDLSFLDKI